MKPDWTPETMPDYFQLKGGTFLEIGAVYLLASGSVEHLRALQGGTALIDRRRFRPNFYIDTGLTSRRFIEDDWLGRNLTVGASVVVGELAPTLWCVGSTLAQEELPHDVSILRTIARVIKAASVSTDQSYRMAWFESAIRSPSPSPLKWTRLHRAR